MAYLVNFIKIRFNLTLKNKTFQVPWGFKVPVFILLVYFFGVFPFVHFLFRDPPWVSQYAYHGYYVFALIAIIFLRKNSLADLGSSRKNLKRNLLIGGVLGMGVACALPLIDWLVEASGLSNQELFSVEANRPVGDPLSNLDLVYIILAVPAVEQFFLIGFITRSLLAKFQPLNAICLSTLIFTLAHFNLDLGTLLLGVISACLLYVTRSIHASLLFHIGCAASWILLIKVYPRLITIFIFLF